MDFGHIENNRKVLLAKCFGAVVGCYLIYGICHEAITRQVWRTDVHRQITMNFYSIYRVWSLYHNDYLDLWRWKIQFHILVNVDSNAWKFFICISSNSNFTKRQHSSTLLFSQVSFMDVNYFLITDNFKVLYSSVGLYSDQITPCNTSATQAR